jgi:carboxyl-terminal processing protease
MVMGVSGHFFDERALLGTIVSRKNRIELRANPRRVNAAGESVAPYAGPVAILVDQLSYSASEFFAGGMQAAGRATVVGRATLGGALAAAFDRLPNGDLLEHPVSDFLTVAGTRIEGHGVHPDIPVAVDAFRTGRDADLDAALAWIQDQRRPE